MKRTAAERHKARGMYRGGLSIPKVAAALKIPQTTVHGWVTDIARPLGRKAPDRQRRLAAWLRSRGRSYAEIGELLGVARQTAHKLALRGGAPRVRVGRE